MIYALKIVIYPSYVKFRYTHYIYTYIYIYDIYDIYIYICTVNSTYPTYTFQYIEYIIHIIKAICTEILSTCLKLGDMLQPVPHISKCLSMLKPCKVR